MLAEAQGGQGWCFFDFDQAFRIICIMLTVLCNVINNLAVLYQVNVVNRTLYPGIFHNVSDRLVSLGVARSAQGFRHWHLEVSYSPGKIPPILIAICSMVC